MRHFVFTRNTSLLDRGYGVIGCGTRGIVVESSGWIPGPKQPDGQPLRDPDDGSVVAGLYEIVFSEDGACEGGLPWHKGTSYWVAAKALAPYDPAPSPEQPTLEAVDLTGSGCPDRESYTFTGALDASGLIVLFGRMHLEALRDSSVPGGALDCKVQLRLRVPKAGRINGLRAVTAYRAELGAATSATLRTRWLINGTELDHKEMTHQGPLDAPLDVSVDKQLPPDLGFCEHDVTLVLEQYLTVSAGPSLAGSEMFWLDSSDYSLDVAACP